MLSFRDATLRVTPGARATRADATQTLFTSADAAHEWLIENPIEDFHPDHPQRFANQFV